MDPSAAGSSEADALEALTRDELARAQAAAQRLHNHSRSSIPLRLPLGPPQFQETSQTSQLSVEDRLKALEAELKEVLSMKQENHSRASPSRFPQDGGLDYRQSPVNSVPIRNRRFSEVLAVSSYRLIDTNENLVFDQSFSLTQVANQIRPRMEGYFFSGEQPLKVLPFLRHLTRIANQSRLSEATLLWIVEDFIHSPAREAFRAQAHRIWPDAVHWLLITFAPESSLEQAVRRMAVSTQAQVEIVKQFGLRLQMESSAMGSLISLSELKSLFSQGLKESVRSLFLAHQPLHELDDTTPLSVLVSRAELLETGTSQGHVSQRVPQRPNPRLPTLITPDPSLELYPDSSEPFDVDETQAMALQVNSDSKGPVCFVCYLTGHWWLECHCLSHIPAEQKEEIAVRRRQYYTEINMRRRNFVQGGGKKSEPTWMSRPGWKSDHGQVPLPPIWPATVLEKSKVPSTENAPGTPKEP